MERERVDRPADAPLRLLIVDDVPRTRELLRRLAELDGRFEVVAEAADGRDALELVRSQEPDVVLLDVRMPRMDGIEALEAIKFHRREAQVVMYSADSTRRHEALDRGADAWVDKTESFRVLADVLAGAWTRARRQPAVELTGEASRAT